MIATNIDAFAQVLSKQGFVLIERIEEPFMAHFIKDEFEIKLNWETFTMPNCYAPLYYPDSADQAMTLLACHGIIKLPIHYKSDADKLHLIEKCGSLVNQSLINQIIKS
jgi:hypothetical protein